MDALIMPSLGADMEDGTLAEWLIAPGAEIARGDVVAVVETQKGAIEIEAFASGVVASLAVAEGETVPVGATIATLRGAGEAAQPVAAEAPSPQPVPEPVSVTAPAAAPPPPAIMPSAGRRASPAARHLAAQLGVDLLQAEGTGPGGAVISGDVRRIGAQQRAMPDAVTPVKRRGLDLDAMRKAIAAAMAKSKREIPHYYLSTQVDLWPATQWLAETNASRTPENRLLMATLFLKASALALREHPQFNGTYEERAFRPSAGIHVGTAVAIRGGGLIAPAIHHCDKLGLDALMRRMRDLVARVRGGGLRSSELTDPTVTVSSLGERGVEALFGVIYPPQVALLGFGRVTETVLAVEGTAVVRPAVALSLAADHRVSDGHRGGLFLRRIAALLQEPEKL
ncbi:MAG: dihydrolipoamide acetyltransferase family protein [Kiloniellales bacterium]